jgi:hypothetical protein
MSYVGVDLHKKVIQICVVQLEGAKRKVICQRRFDCRAVTAILEFFNGLGPVQVVVEATASYEWSVKLVEPLADSLSHPRLEAQSLPSVPRQSPMGRDARELARRWRATVDQSIAFPLLGIPPRPLAPTEPGPIMAAACEEKPDEARPQRLFQSQRQVG